MRSIENKRPEVKSELMELIHSVDGSTTLNDFVIRAAPLTNDKGAAMTKFVETELSEFKQLVQNVYAHRELDINTILCQRLAEEKDKYDRWERNILSRYEDEFRVINELLPNLNFAQYSTTSHHMTNILTEQIQKELVSKPSSLWVEEVKQTMTCIEDDAKKVEKETCRLNQQITKVSRALQEIQMKTKTNESKNAQDVLRQQLEEKIEDLKSRVEEKRKVLLQRLTTRCQ